MVSDLNIKSMFKKIPRESSFQPAKQGRLFHKYLLAILLAFTSCWANAQNFDDIFGPKMPSRVDTFYYSFYNGVQMIEVDHLTYWDNKVYFMEQTQPRALSYSMIMGPPPPNEYFFRDTSGAIIKAFNTRQDLKVLTQHFRKVPINKITKNPFFAASSAHAHKEWKYSGAWPYSPNSLYFFNGFYKVYDMGDQNRLIGVSHPASPSKFIDGPCGLIDSLGNIRVPMEYEEILPLANWLMVKKDNKWGIIDKNMNTILPLEYDECKNDAVGFWSFYKNEKVYEVYDIKRQQLLHLDGYDRTSIDYMYRSPQFIYVVKDNKVGFLDTNFQVVVPPQYDICEYRLDYNPTPVRIFKNGKWGYIDNDLNEVIPCIYDHVEIFNRDSIALVWKGSDIFCINPKGERVGNCDLKPSWELKRDRRVYRGASGKDLYGIINGIGEIEIPFIYENITEVAEGYKVQLDRKWGYIDKSGNQLLPCLYDYQEFNSNHKPPRYSIIKTAEKNNERYGLISRSPIKEVVPCEYEGMRFDWSGHIIFMKDKKYGLLDTNGAMQIEPKYDLLEGLDTNGYARVKIGDNHGFIDINEKEIIPIMIRECGYRFLHNLVWFKQGDKFGYYNTQGKVAIAPRYDYATDFFGKIAAVKKGDKWGYIDTTGKQVVDFKYESVNWSSWMVFKYQSVKKNGKWGIIDIDGNEVIPCMYDDIRGGYTEKYGFIVTLNGKQIHINNKNEKITDCNNTY